MIELVIINILIIYKILDIQYIKRLSLMGGLIFMNLHELYYIKENN